MTVSQLQILSRIYFYIYCIYNTISGKCYIGQTDDPNRRWTKEHLIQLRNNRHFNKYLQRAWNSDKYNESDFEFFILEEGYAETQEEIDAIETQWIKPYRAQGLAYNLTDGGNKPPSQKGVIRSKEHCENISKSKSGALNPMYGKVYSEEELERMRGREPWNKGKPGCFSDETIKLMSEAKKGRPSTNKDKPMSEEQKIKISESRGKKYKAFGEEKTIGMWIRDSRCIVSLSTLEGRIACKWDMNKALTTPKKG